MVYFNPAQLYGYVFKQIRNKAENATVYSARARSRAQAQCLPSGNLISFDEILNFVFFVSERFFEVSITNKDIYNHYFSPKNGQKLGWQMGHSTIFGILYSNSTEVFCAFPHYPHKKYRYYKCVFFYYVLGIMVIFLKIIKNAQTFTLSSLFIL